MMKKGTTGRRRHPSRTRAPTKAPGGPKRWPERRWAARTIRVVVFVLPLVLSFLFAWVLSNAMAVPDQLWARVVRWLFIAALATGVLILAQRLLRRLLPLAALLSLTLVFPDETPSRFGVALRSMSARNLDKRLAEIDREGLGETPREAAETLLELVAALSRHDRLTRGHSERVRAYAVMIGEEMGLPSEEVDRLRWAALVHDVGKLAVPSEILTKPGRLTEEEFEVIRGHPGAGRRLVAPLADWLGPSAAAVYEHHERWEGGGYPTGVRSEHLALTSRIVSVADAFDVMTSVRSYQEASSASAARAELQRCSGTQFDPQVVRAMMNISLGRLWRTMGPLSWLAQLSLFPRVLVQASPAAAPVAAGLVSLVLTGLADIATPWENRVGSSDQVLSVDLPSPEIDISSGRLEGSGGVGSADGDPASTSDGTGSTGVSDAADSSSATDATTTLVVGRLSTTTIVIGQIPAVIGTTPPSSSRVPITGTTTPSNTTTLPNGRPTTTVATSDTTATTTGSSPGPTTTGPGTTSPGTTSPGTTSPSTTSPATTSTTLPLPAGALVLTSLGPGDQVSQPVLQLEASGQFANSTLPNYDTDRNDDPGLTIVASPTDVVTSSPEGVQVWRLPPTVTEIAGPVSLTLWLAPEGPLQTGLMHVRAALFDCNGARSDCRRLSWDSAQYAATTTDFVPVDFDLSVAGGHEVSPGRAIELRVAVISGSSNNVLVGYDSVSTPSVLVIAQ